MPEKEDSPFNWGSVRMGSLTRANHLPRTNNRTVLFNPLFNKGTAFSLAEREKLGITGHLPYAVETISQQVRRAYRQYSSFKNPMSKYIYLVSLRERNITLFYRLLLENLEEMMPIIYTPTVGEACVDFDLNFRQVDGFYISLQQKGRIHDVLGYWHENLNDDVSIIVVTDGSRILGLGDLGVNGMGIPLGKLSLYVAASGFYPSTVLPVVIDVGTNNEKYLNDEFYLGLRDKRCDDKDYYELMDEFIYAVRQRWPRALLQFEDFSNNHCFALLERYRKKILCFNDDIQGTGAVIAAAFLNSLKLVSTEVGKHRILFVGGGSAAIGVADQISCCLSERYGYSREEVLNMIYICDSRGLLHRDRMNLPEFKKRYQRDDFVYEDGDLFSIAEFVRPTALIGLSGQPGIFTEKLCRFMAELNERPMIFALSNPTSKAEVLAKDAVKWTEGRVIYNAGSPMQPVEYNGITIHPNQGNNLYTFPGLGFGSWLCHANEVTDEMITATSLALADTTSEEDLSHNRLYPEIKNIRDISAAIATRVMQTAHKQGVARWVPDCIADFKRTKAFVKNSMYFPEYKYM